MNTDEKRQRRAVQRKLTSEQRRELIAEYSAAPADQALTELHLAARYQISRAWLQWKRVAGGGPRFHRTASGKIRYRKSDAEAFLAATLTPHSSTSEYGATGVSK